MPRKKKEDSAEAPQETPHQSIAVTAAKAIGKAAGKIASLAGASGPVLKAPAKKRGRLAPRNKKRLPRKVKKAQKKTEARAS